MGNNGSNSIAGISKNMTECTKCGKTIWRHNFECPYCHKFPSLTEKEDKAYAELRKYKSVSIIACALLFVVAVVLFGAFLNVGYNKTKSVPIEYKEYSSDMHDGAYVCADVVDAIAIANVKTSETYGNKNTVMNEYISHVYYLAILSDENKKNISVLLLEKNDESDFLEKLEARKQNEGSLSIYGQTENTVRGYENYYITQFSSNIAKAEYDRFWDENGNLLFNDEIDFIDDYSVMVVNTYQPELQEVSLGPGIGALFVWLAVFLLIGAVILFFVHKYYKESCAAFLLYWKKEMSEK